MYIFVHFYIPFFVHSYFIINNGLVLSKVIADDNIANMFYGVLGTTDKKKKPYTEVYVFKGEKVLEWIQNAIKTDNSKVSE